MGQKTKIKNLLMTWKAWTPRVLVLLLAFKGLQCAHKEINTGWDPQTPAPWAVPAPSNQFSFMAYNVENLFDAEHDQGREDFTYLPLSLKKTKEVQDYCGKQNSKFRRQECVFNDWTDEVVKAKMKSIAGVILQVRGKGPDILFLEEVENVSILKRLNKEYLQEAGYTTEVLLEGNDRRGIDIGLLSRFPLVGKPEIHHYADNTRGILVAKLKLPTGDVVTVAGIHFPSQANPVETRLAALDKLRWIITRDGPKSLVLVGGDGNITTAENRKHKLFESLEDFGIISHRFACEKCLGTHNYQGKWDYLDWIFVSNELAKGTKYQVIKDSISTPNRGPGQMGSDGLPLRFDHESKKGITDHLPIFADIQYQSKTK